MLQLNGFYCFHFVDYNIKQNSFRLCLNNKACFIIQNDSVNFIIINYFSMTD